jgi:hypothetical protein
MTTRLAERQNVAALPSGRGRGPSRRPADLPLPVGLCPVPSCGDQVSHARLMCRRDWYQVPKRQRDRVWRTWRSGSEADSHDHQVAVLKAIAAARVARVPRWRRPVARLRRLINPGYALGGAK